MELGNVKVMNFGDKIKVKIYPYKLLSPERVLERSEEDSDNNEELYKVVGDDGITRLNNLVVEDKLKRFLTGAPTSERKKAINIENRLYNILGLGLCNKWDYFLTITLDPDKINRYSADDITKAIGNEFHKIKKRGIDVQYMYILEKHKDGAFHAHGFINIDLKCVDLNYTYKKKNGKIAKLSKSKFEQFGISQKYFNLGICSISPVHSKEDVINYCSKYITKDLALRDKHGHLIFHSKGLKTYDIQYGFSGYNTWINVDNVVLGNYGDRTQYELINDFKTLNYEKNRGIVNFDIDINNLM